eukprot:764542-Hanusia_phi.AAC.3
MTLRSRRLRCESAVSVSAGDGQLEVVENVDGVAEVRKVFEERHVAEKLDRQGRESLSPGKTRANLLSALLCCT